MRTHVLRLTALLAVAGLWVVLRSVVMRPAAKPATDAHAVGFGSGAAAPAPGPVRRLTVADRARLAQQIAAADRRRTGTGFARLFGTAAQTPLAGSAAGSDAAPLAPAPPPVSTPVVAPVADAVGSGSDAGSDAGSGSDADLEAMVPTMLAALHEALPYLEDCYRTHTPERAAPGKTALALLTLTNDHDLGAIVDADRIVDERNAPLPPELESCLRDSLETLAWPPLGPDQTVTLSYSFTFEAGSAGSR